MCLEVGRCGGGCDAEIQRERARGMWNKLGNENATDQQLQRPAAKDADAKPSRIKDIKLIGKYSRERTSAGLGDRREKVVD